MWILWIRIRWIRNWIRIRNTGFSNGFTVTWTPNLAHKIHMNTRLKNFLLLQKLLEEKLYTSFVGIEAKFAAN
jgi:hypothetical protein